MTRSKTRPRAATASGPPSDKDRKKAVSLPGFGGRSRSVAPRPAATASKAWRAASTPAPPSRSARSSMASPSSPGTSSEAREKYIACGVSRSEGGTG